ncbi:conserved hypothetical protein [Desulforapulum autotrophicum HRM2]|uniref:Thoeris protein ThsB TIR-like domain-containing protein n=1 Tax=Desulforapulum autotrophicum (strain ATCC 43914 / DSM 3382 / VKM B-1955 / HRM2) TaxID=177437 RepID=C0Q9K6_DESAH|nr:TIR domain-containing protein [Desulforapulum autotrophicum]ACN14570.1 conserved hypothetical protein [Desulforapulum autotrophicum HRM2]
MSKTYNLFISHSWAYSDAYDKFVSLLDNRPYFHYKNHSVPQNNPIHSCGTDAQLYQAIKNKIQGCHIIIIMAGVYSSYSKWINKEIKIAKEEFYSPKPIIAVKPWAQTKMSSVVRDNANAIVAWNTESIISKIRLLG